MPPKEKAEAQTFGFETMACVLAVMDAKGATLGTRAYELMATLDGNRSSHAFQHQFRAVKHRGKELASQLSGETATPTPKTPKTAKKPAAASSRKRNKKTADDDDNDNDEDKIATETPSKKTKIKKEASVKAPVEAPVDAPDGDARGMYSSFFDDAMLPEE